jgi:phage terminase large subunit
MEVFQNTTALKKIFQLSKRIRALSGGTSACKTIGILVWLIDYGQSTKNEVMTVVAESHPHLKLGAIRDFKNIMLANGYWDDKAWNQSNSTYTFPDKTILEFISFDKFGKAHGPRRDILFLNEANNLPYHIADQLITRTRKIVWMDWNPSEEFWFYTEILPVRGDIDFITLTYLDNEALDDVSRMEIEAHKNNKRWWQVYGLGKLGEIEGRIYTGWNIIDEIPHEARLERRGLDFGYSVDPTVLVDIYKYNDGFIIDEQTYQKGLSNKSISDIIKNLSESQVMVVCDSAEPKSIDELKLYGINAYPAQKGQGSVNQGIQYVQNQKISLTSRSVRTIKSYRNYMWKQDNKTGVFMQEPDDTIHEWSNSMDAIRYGLDSYRPRVERVKKKRPQTISPYKLRMC